MSTTKSQSTSATYDLIEEGRLTRELIAANPKLVAQARNMGTMAMLSKVLLALSDCGFFEYVRHNEQFRVADATAALGVDDEIFTALMGYLSGHGVFVSEGDALRVTPHGREWLNAYARGMVNMYEGAYAGIFNNLSGLLQGRIALDDPALRRSPTHTAAGTSYLTCGFAVPAVFDAIKDHGCSGVLDLGCGTGDFLIQYLRQYPEGVGVGVDMAPEALERARANAEAFGVADRASFYCATVGSDNLDIPREKLDRVEVVTSMYMMHEFGRDGRQAIVDIIRSIGKELPNRLFLMLEVEGADPNAFSQAKAEHKGRLDYWLIHVLSRQGLPRPVSDWHSILEDAGGRIEADPIRTGGSYIYQARL